MELKIKYNTSRKITQLLESLDTDEFCHLDIFPKTNIGKTYYICFTNEEGRAKVKETIDRLFKSYGGTTKDSIDNRFIDKAEQAGVLPFKYCIECNIPLDEYKKLSPGKIKFQIVNEIKSVGFDVGYTR